MTSPILLKQVLGFTRDLWNCDLHCVDTLYHRLLIMPQRRIALVGDSFIKRLSRDSLALAVLNLNDISAFSYHHKLVDGT